MWYTIVQRDERYISTRKGREREKTVSILSTPVELGVTITPRIGVLGVIITPTMLLLLHVTALLGVAKLDLAALAG